MITHYPNYAILLEADPTESLGWLTFPANPPIKDWVALVAISKPHPMLVWPLGKHLFQDH